MWRRIIKKLKNWYGFGTAAPNLKALALTVMVIVTAAGHTFQSCDRKRMRKQIYKLKVENLMLETSVKDEKSRGKVSLLELKLKHMSKKASDYQAQRAALRLAIVVNKTTLANSKKRLDMKIGELKDKSTDELLYQDEELRRVIDNEKAKKK